MDSNTYDKLLESQTELIEIETKLLNIIKRFQKILVKEMSKVD